MGVNKQINKERKETLFKNFNKEALKSSLFSKTCSDLCELSWSVLVFSLTQVLICFFFPLNIFQIYYSFNQFSIMNQDLTYYNFSCVIVNVYPFWVLVPRWKILHTFQLWTMHITLFLFILHSYETRLQRLFTIWMWFVPTPPLFT